MRLDDLVYSPLAPPPSGAPTFETLAAVGKKLYKALPPTVSVARAIPSDLVKKGGYALADAAIRYAPDNYAFTAYKAVKAAEPYARIGYNLFKSGALTKSFNQLTSSTSSTSMPYVRRNRRSSRGRLSFRAARRVPSYKRSAPMSRVSVVQRLPRTQIKQHFTIHTEAGITPAAGHVWPIGGISNGSGEDQRENNNIKLLSFDIRMVLSQSSVRETPTSFPVNFRVIMIKWLQGYMSPSMGTILLDSGIGNAYLAPYRQSEMKNFQVLYDRVHRVEPSHAGQVENGNLLNVFKVVNIRKSINQYITYNGSATNNYDKSYYMIIVPDINTNRIQASVSTRFIDV